MYSTLTHGKYTTFNASKAIWSNEVLVLASKSIFIIIFKYVLIDDMMRDSLLIEDALYWPIFHLLFENDILNDDWL